MRFENVRPTFSALLGVIIYAWLAPLWSRWVPTRAGEKSRTELQVQHGWKLSSAKWLSVVLLLAVALLYQTKYFDRHDWRPFGIAWGGISLLYFTMILLGSVRGGAGAVRECFTLFAMINRVPVSVSIMLLILLAGIGAISFAALI